MDDKTTISTKEEAVDTLAHDIEKFTKDVDCLQTILPLLMLVMGHVCEDALKTLHEFIDEHGADKKKENNSRHFTINIEDLSGLNKLKRQRGHADKAYLLLPRHFVTSLIAQYDSFLGKVIRFIFAVKPELLNASDRTLVYTDLVNFDDIASAREYLIEKEVESVIRKSHADQFKWLHDTLGTPFDKNLKSWPAFIELTERRNLFVHCDGLVSSQYLNACRQHNCKIDPSLKVGDRLSVPTDYFEEAHRCVYEIGVKLSQVIWRRLCPDYKEKADISITEITYNLIENRNYEIAIRLLDFFTSKTIKHDSEIDRLVMVINLAQANKWLGREDKCSEVLNQEDWTACQDRFQIAVAILRGKYDDSFIIMRRLRHDEKFHKTFYKDWPLFKELRKQPKFLVVYEECYEEQFKIEESTNKDTSDQEAKEQSDGEHLPSEAHTEGAV